MVKINVEKFTKPESVVQCKTREQASQLLEWAKAQRLFWGDEVRSIITEITYWKDYGESTCYRLDFDDAELTYGGVEFYQSRGYTIIEFEDLLVDTTAPDTTDIEQMEILEDRITGLIRRTHKELTVPRDLLSSRSAAKEIIKLILERKESLR